MSRLQLNLSHLAVAWLQHIGLIFLALRLELRSFICMCPIYYSLQGSFDSVLQFSRTFVKFDYSRLEVKGQLQSDGRV